MMSVYEERMKTFVNGICGHREGTLPVFHTLVGGNQNWLLIEDDSATAEFGRLEPRNSVVASPTTLLEAEMVYCQSAADFRNPV